MTKLLCENGVDATIRRWATSQRTSKCIVPTWQGPYLRGLALQECERNVRPTFTAGCTGITHAFVSPSMKNNPYSFVYSWSWHKASAHWIYDCNVDGDTAHRFRSISFKPRESSGGEAVRWLIFMVWTRRTTELHTISTVFRSNSACNATRMSKFRYATSHSFFCSAPIAWAPIRSGIHAPSIGTEKSQ